MVQGKKLLLDFGTTLKDGKAQLLTEGKAHPYEAGSIKALREHGFPLALMEKGSGLPALEPSIGVKVLIESFRYQPLRHAFESRFERRAEGAAASADLQILQILLFW